MRFARRPDAGGLESGPTGFGQSVIRLISRTPEPQMIELIAINTSISLSRIDSYL